MKLKEKDLELIRKYSLKNAFDYNKAQIGSVIGKILSENPDLKINIQEIKKQTKKIVGLVNKMSKEEIEKEMKKFEYKEKKEEKKAAEKRIELPSATQGAVITRFLPDPSGYPHLGHAKSAFLSSEAAGSYNGKMILRIDDTNPELVKQEYVDEFKRALNWLGIGWENESYTSDSIELLYQYGIELIKAGKAYICGCSQENVKLGRRERRGCPCREKPIVQNIREFERMIGGEYPPGKAILRFVGNMASFNSVMRDPTLFRITKTTHFRQNDKYVAWPSYDFATPILDSINGITHAMRSKEYELRDELYNKILDSLGLRKPILISFARLEIKNNTTSKREIRDYINKKFIPKWDDPRLLTISALKRRGIQPAAIKNFVLSFGIGKAESRVTLEPLLIENRKLLDPKSKRYNFVKDQILIKITNLENERKSGEERKLGEERKISIPRKILIPLHPTVDLGSKELIVKDSVYISKSDIPKENEVIRLKDFCNIKIIKVSDKAIEAEEIGNTDTMPEKKIQWVSAEEGEYINAKILRPKDLLIGKEFNKDSLIIEEGICEKECANIKSDEVVQFVRYGFVRKESNGTGESNGTCGKLIFVYSC